MNLNTVLIEWNPTTGMLTYSVEGHMQTSIVVSMTKPRRAQLNRFLSNDQMLPIITRWNALIEMTKGPVTFGPTNSPDNIPNTFSGIIGELATAGVNMQIHLKHQYNIVTSLCPIPIIPPNPYNP
ncbi:hypothetical protein BIV60_18430 [Bacillus sp. MUM 116]|uniref:hypothetical protein n=1 Tax=Bacillus sp. MUM 116 TaxID=1678002 RepID=UPI0008F56D13|nr:hypothetical protein [Bacillus sp. MUM 116]OIK11217.1 hypothetical protein BIV60_18430 [Bacillus sp. MUM 116]